MGVLVVLAGLVVGALVVGVASSALFDLEASDAVFRQDGEQKYREYQRDHLDDAPPKLAAAADEEELFTDLAAQVPTTPFTARRFCFLASY